MGIVGRRIIIRTNINDIIKKYFTWGIVVIFISSSLIHSLYEFSGKFIIFAIISPVNESLWEHLKMPLLPTLIWWIISYYCIKKQITISFMKWLTSAIIAYFICIIFILVFYYTYTGALGIHSVFLDILGLLLGIIFGEFISLKIFKDMEIKPIHNFLAYSFLMIIFIMFIAFTFNPPHIPLFKDLSTGKYGLN